MKEQGQTLSFLHPFQFAFYRKFGWETYTDYMKYEIPTAMLPKLPLQTGSIVRVDEQIPLLNGIYRSYAVRYNGTLDRDEQWWKRRIFASKKEQQPFIETLLAYRVGMYFMMLRITFAKFMR